MKKLFLLILGLGIIAGLFYFSTKPTVDETKTTGEAEESMEINDDLSVPELEDFDQEIQGLDESINQL
ncbi:MAG: hypothetical protein Q8P47_02495 [Candidatus Beckwithbacteria bacterium]|nr:hypothetical protein [Candidatus Beckwithbacteria bacterium]